MAVALFCYYLLVHKTSTTYPRTNGWLIMMVMSNVEDKTDMQTSRRVIFSCV